MLRPPFLSVLILDDAISGPCKGDPDLLKCPHGILYIYIAGPNIDPPNTIILIIGTAQKVFLNLGNPSPCKSLIPIDP